MTYRIVWLSFALMLVIVGVAYVSLPPAGLAIRSVSMLGADATLALAEQGRGAALNALLQAELAAATPWFALGIALALVLRMALRLWQREQPSPTSVKVVDAAGIEVELYGAAFDHVPVMSRMPLRPLPDARFKPGASDLEMQALAAIAAVDGIPADTRGAHKETLLQHTLRVYDKACELYGPGSLQAIAAATHDIGKLLAYKEHGAAWIEIYPFHDNLTSIVLSRLPAFWRMPLRERTQVATVISVLCSGQTPADLDPELRDAVNACRALDRGATAIEKRVAAGSREPAPEIDFIALCAALRALPNDLADWNINARLREGAAADGWWLPDEKILLLPDFRIRNWLARQVSTDMGQQLNLAQPSTGTHAANAPITEALRNEGLLAEVVQGMAMKSGWWRATHARSQSSVVAALRGDRFAPALAERWGKPKKEALLEAL